MSRSNAYGDGGRDLAYLIKQTSNYDKDERYMATNDIASILTSGEIKIDVRMERAICSAILKQLDDTSNDVQSIAVKCLSILVKQCHVEQVESICDTLSRLMMNDSAEDLRDVYSIGLKTAISDMSEAAGKVIADAMAPRLLNGIISSSSLSVKVECIDILSEMLKRFGESMGNVNGELTRLILKQLSNDKAQVRKRSIVCEVPHATD